MKKWWSLLDIMKVIQKEQHAKGPTFPHLWKIGIDYNFISRVGSSYFWWWEGQWELHRSKWGNLGISNLSPNTQQSINDVATLDVAHLTFFYSKIN